MARETGIYRRTDSRCWWIATTLPNGQRIRQSAGTENRREAEALLAKLKVKAYQEANFGMKPERSWQEAVVRYLLGKQHLRSFKDVRRICRRLDPYLGTLQPARDHGRRDLTHHPGGVEAGQPTGDGEPLARHDSQPVADGTR